MAKYLIVCTLLIAQALGLGYVNQQLIPGADGLAPGLKFPREPNALRDTITNGAYVTPAIDDFLGRWYPNSQVEEFLPLNGFFLCDPINVNVNGFDETFKRPLDFGGAATGNSNGGVAVCRIIATDMVGNVTLLNQVLVQVSQCAYVRINGLQPVFSCPTWGAVLGMFDSQPGNGNRAQPNSAHVSQLQSDLQYEGFPVPDGFLQFDSTMQLYSRLELFGSARGTAVTTSTIDCWRQNTAWNTRQNTETFFTGAPNTVNAGNVGTALVATGPLTLETRLANCRLNS